MRIGIVLHPFGTSSKGLEHYIFETTRSILEERGEGVTYTVFVKGNPDTSALPKDIAVVTMANNFLWKFGLFLWYRKIDTFIFYTETAPFFLWRKSIIVFFDAAYYYFGASDFVTHIKRNILIWWRTNMLHRVRHIVAISNASKDDLIDNFSVEPRQISVIYPGFKSLTAQKNVTYERSVVPYFMYIGPVKERKNVIAIIKSFILFKKTTHLPHELYLVGRKSSGVYAEAVNEIVAHSEYKDSIIFKTSVSDEELYCVYANAEALVFPSLLEGFGMPILEAFSCGCQVITSNTTSTKEVAGNTGILVDPNSSNEIVAALTYVARGEYNKQKFQNDAAQQIKHFSWSKSGREWQEIFRNNALI